MVTPIYVVLDIDVYGRPEIVDNFLTSEEAYECVKKRHYLGYVESCYEMIYPKTVESSGE